MAEKTEKHPGGRPSEFNEKTKRILIKLALYDLTDRQMADVIGVTVQTLTNWKQKDEEFFASLKSAKEKADQEVVKSLNKRAKGFRVKAVKIFCNSQGEVTTQDYSEYYPPDTTAAIFWLKNRQPEKWKDVKENRHTGAEGGPILFSNLSDEELRELVQKPA